MPPNPSPTNSGTGEGQSSTLLIENIFDFTSLSDFLIAAIAATFTIAYASLIVRAIASKGFRKTIIEAIEEMNSSTARFVAIFFGVREKNQNQDRNIYKKIDELKNILESKSYNVSDDSESKIVEYFDKALKRISLKN